MDQPRVFLSHSSKDAAFTARLEAVLREAGATVYRISADQGGDFVKAIDDALAACEWLVLVLTTDALASPWVQQEIRAAIRLKNQGSIREILPIQAGPVDLRAIPPLWGVYNVFDATRDYVTACAGVLRALGLSALQQDASAEKNYPRYPFELSPPLGAPSGTFAPVSVPALPDEPALHLTPNMLYDLGFQGRVINGVEVVLPPLCMIPGGPFTMGSNKWNDNQAEADELPQGSVTLGAFLIGMYPVTVAEYACAVRDKAVREPREWSKQLTRLDHPIVNVSWHDALTYAAWLAKLKVELWRLPSEAEWEKAARGTDGRIYPWGKWWDKAHANTDDGGPGATTPVGAYAERGDASPCGAHDLAGNVWEWTSSLFAPYPYNHNDGREAPDSVGNRVLRGGSWGSRPRHARVAYRGTVGGGIINIRGYVGFRLIRAALDSA